ncbi:MAG TPA: DUF3175 domain-containing protein [Candidatus Sulfotelmatobacter sp.]|nr:DUF3175 domain-containing protein [Candidatus Sulfotelmatobacter sp.]
MDDESQNRWSADVTAHDRHDVGGGVFSTGTAAEIADAVIGAALEEGADEHLERRAMAKLTFYENRAGRHLSPERRAVLDEAKELVRARAASR